MTDDPESLATRDQLTRLLATYDLSPWIFTTEVAIDRNTIPHSHPVLTIHTRHLHRADLLLATFLHEQLHWFLAGQPHDRVRAAFDDLRALFPSVPVGPAESGGEGDESTYLHLIVNYLEYEAVAAVLGSSAARAVIEFWAGDHYRWIYRMVLERGAEIRSTIASNELLCPSGVV